MANTTAQDLSKTKKTEEQIFGEVKHHAEIGFQETDRRSWGKNRIGAISFNEADELFRSWIDEGKWPYDALLFDPRVFTFIFEKTSRLISNKPKGKLIPREGSDILAAKVNGSLLDYQWDMANIGGSMISKWALMDINTRKYGAAFALCKWRYECDADGQILFDGPDMQVLNNRDIAHDLTATAIENCNWFQVRQYVTIQDLQMVNDQRSKPVYKNLDKLKFSVQKSKEADDMGGGAGGDSRSTNWTSRSRAIAGLEQDPVGRDFVYKTIEIITEYRKDRWITFAPRHGVVLRDIPNPYKNHEIPVTMLRYYQIDDDLYGLSEIEPIKGLQKAINAVLCQYVDEINQQLYSPIAVGPGVRQHTLEWGKGARWIMNNPMTDFRLVESRSNASQYFQTTYSVLVAAMQNALGESSLGTSNVQPFQADKTATEVKALQLQRNARDNFNQIFLAEAIKRQYMLWHSMNQQLLFADPTRKIYIIRVVGDDALKFYQNKGLDEVDMENNDVADSMDRIGDGSVETADMVNENASKPRYPVDTGNGYVPKLQTDELGGGGSLYVTPDDLKGTFDFAIDVESMTVNADEERKQARQAAVSLLATNPNVMQLLASEGVKPKFKELFVTWLEDLGFSDAERFFEKSQAPAPGGPGGGPSGAGGGNPAEQLISSIMAKQGGGGNQPPTPTGGIPGGTNPNAGGEAQQTSPFQVNTGTLSPEALNSFFGPR